MKAYAGEVEYLIDEEDHNSTEGRVYVNSDPVGYLRLNSGQLLHRWILGLEAGDPRIGDHINGDVLDNRRSNLRVVTPTESNYNRRPWNRAGLPAGVSRTVSGRYQARIKHEGTAYYVGTHDTPEQASSARRALLAKVSGKPL